MTPSADTTDTLEIRRATADDLPQILEIAHRSLGWIGGGEDERFFRWKHFENAFGASPMWLALDGARIAGFRTFLRWRFVRSDGTRISAVRAVDTATHPDYQGRGVFTRLTLGALDELRADGVQLIFNTPNDKSLPGYLKMGWTRIGRLPTAVLLPRLGSLRALAHARTAANRWSIEINVGQRASDVFGERAEVENLLRALKPAAGLSTERTPEFLAWRYGYRGLRYRALLAGPSLGDGLVVFRLRRRGDAVEGVICDVLIPGDDASVERALLREVARATQAGYLLRLTREFTTPGPFIRIPMVGPVLAGRSLEGHPTPVLKEWNLSLGDVALL
jgi:GNAT superfamily N-acetyltransferase